MFHFEDPQDEANFWSKSILRTKLEIIECKRRIEKLRANLGYAQEDLDSLKNSKDVHPDFDEASVRQQLQDEWHYGRLFKSYSHIRYLHRLRLWTKVFHKGKRLPKLQHHVWWLLHNCLAHPAIGFIPCRWTFKLHDWTSHRLNHPWKTDSLSDFPNPKNPNYETTEAAIKVAERADWSAKL
jgi:hypothetical protein